ncbi:hypothetical protein JTB14_009678 [Gonioctena quinquepunctata]|nr:hypothetical protein JTB14_009678 [Gonioctena quinquepunctata]
MEKNDFKIAENKTEAVILEGPRNRKGVPFRLCNCSVTQTRSLKYLGILWMIRKEHQEYGTKSLASLAAKATRKEAKKRHDGIAQKMLRNRQKGLYQTWYSCNYRDTNYFLTQFLAKYGSYRAYTHHINQTADNVCIYYNEIDTAEHTIFTCKTCHNNRHQLQTSLKERLTSGNKILIMLRSPTTWKTISEKNVI